MNGCNAVNPYAIVVEHRALKSNGISAYEEVLEEKVGGGDSAVPLDLSKLDISTTLFLTCE